MYNSSNRSILYIRERLEGSWDISTTYSPSVWSTNNRAKGQCAASSLIVQDVLGGLLLSADIILPDGRREKHYWNNINGLDEDLTWKQFPDGTKVDMSSVEEVDREYLLSNSWFVERYNALKSKFYG